MSEARLQNAIEAYLAQQADDLIAAMRKNAPGVLDDALFWQAQESEMRRVLRPILADLAGQGVQAVADRFAGASIGVNWHLANQQAAAWAEAHGGDLVSRVTETTRRQIGQQVADWMQSGKGMPDLIDRISSMKSPEGKPLFNAVRAESIATTEATNTYAAANTQAWEAAGYAPVAFRPAAHVRCRCRTNPATLPDGSKVIIWYTVRDERVCEQPIMTPWGEVAGCKALNGIILSSGQHLGKKLSEVRSNG